MKTKKNKRLIIALAGLLALSFTVYAQGPKAQKKGGIPNLTEEQKAQIKDLRTPHMKDMLKYKAEINKLEAELKILEIADNPDEGKINSKIDEISAVKGKVAKTQSKHKRDVRSILTDEQKVYFDAHGKKNKSQHCKHTAQKHRKKGGGKM